jgi:hypothetical protein
MERNTANVNSSLISKSSSTHEKRKQNRHLAFRKDQNASQNHILARGDALAFRIQSSRKRMLLLS